MTNMPMVPAMRPTALRTLSRGRGPLFGDLDSIVTEIMTFSRLFAQGHAHGFQKIHERKRNIFGGAGFSLPHRGT